jgi:hypothetical protein
LFPSCQPIPANHLCPSPFLFTLNFFIHHQKFDENLKYKTKYLNLYNQKGGGEFINFNFDITANNSLPGYEYIRRIKGEVDKPIRISVDYVDKGETQKINILSIMHKVHTFIFTYF